MLFHVTLLAVALAALPQATHPHQRPPPSLSCASAFEDPRRDQWQKPGEVIAALELRPQDVVADLGAGTGYFTRRLARHVAKVYAIDINERFLKLAKENSPGNVEIIVAAHDDPRLPPTSVDLIFLCNTLHHISNRAAYYPKLARALKPGGRIVNIDFHKRDLPVGPRREIKLAQEEVVAEFELAGLRLAKSLDLLPYQYFLVFRRE